MKQYTFALVALPLFAAIFFMPNTPSGIGLRQAQLVVTTDLTEMEKKAGWKMLFNGKNTEGWHVFKKQTDGSAWKVDGDALMLDPSVKDANGKRTGNGDLVTDGEYENYELRLDWKIAPCGNSGIIFNSVENDQVSTPWQSGPEMQVLDNACHPDAKIIKHKAGDLYDLIESKAINVKPVGEWNSIRLIVKKGHLEQWQNGKKMVETDMWTPAWKELIAKSKFKSMPLFGTIKKGHLVLQDHGDKVWFKNIKIKEFK